MTSGAKGKGEKGSENFKSRTKKIKKTKQRQNKAKNLMEESTTRY